MHKWGMFSLTKLINPGNAGGSENTFKLLVSRVSYREGFLRQTSRNKIRPPLNLNLTMLNIK